MSTIVATTLNKRTGAGTTVFSPYTVEKDGTARLKAPSSTFAHLAPELALKSWRTGNGRRAICQVAIPQVTVDSDGLPTKRGTISAKLEIYVPDSAVQTDVNDIVGYVESALAVTVTNIDDILVDGVGVY